jgi:hypothetical protein
MTIHGHPINSLKYNTEPACAQREDGRPPEQSTAALRSPLLDAAPFIAGLATGLAEAAGHCIYDTTAMIAGSLVSWGGLAGVAFVLAGVATRTNWGRVQSTVLRQSSKIEGGE